MKIFSFIINRMIISYHVSVRYVLEYIMNVKYELVTAVPANIL